MNLFEELKIDRKSNSHMEKMLKNCYC